MGKKICTRATLRIFIKIKRVSSSLNWVAATKTLFAKQFHYARDYSKQSSILKKLIRTLNYCKQ